MSFIVNGCNLCGTREAPPPHNVSEEYRPWCRSITGVEFMCDLCREFEQLQDQINGLVEKRHQLKARITLYHRNEIMQKIPPEVLSNIFQFFVSPDSDSQPNPYSPLILGAICGRWRAIAWSTPRLWSSISVNFETGSIGDKLQLAREWLSRSGQLPLSISISAGIVRDLPTLPVSLLSALIDVVNGYACRWRILDIRLPPPMLPLFHADPHGISILLTLRIYPAISIFGASQVSERFNPINPCPSPLVVKIFSVHFQSIGICWDKVTHLDVAYFSVDECFEVLRQSPSLTNCRFDNIKSNQHDFPLPESVLYHPNLTSLEVIFLGPWTFFQHISFPSLISLSVDSNSISFPTQGLLSFLRRSSPPLHELRLLSFEDEDGESIIQILNGTPLLKNLHLYPCIDDEHNPSRLFQRLSDPSSTDNASKFLPRLETMSYIGLLNFPWGLIPKIFGPTWRPLSNFRFHFYGLSEEDPEEAYIDETTLSQIWELQRRGISIEIRHTSLGTDFLEISRRWLSERLDL